MEPVNIHQAKNQLSHLPHVVEQGEEVVLARVQPVAAPGAMRGQIQLADDFDAPLDELLMR